MIIAIVLLEYGLMYQLRNVDTVPGYEWCNVVRVDNLSHGEGNAFFYVLLGHRYEVRTGAAKYLVVRQQAIGPVPHPTEDPC